MHHSAAMAALALGLCSAVCGAERGENPLAEGQRYLEEADFRKAVLAFERAVRAEPECAAPYFWLGKALARQAEASSPLLAGRHARKARIQLEWAFQLDPHNREYARELFELYAGSPEYFRGSLERAATIVEESDVDHWTADDMRRHLTQTRRERNGAEWEVERAVRGVWAAAGYAVPRF